MGNIIDNPIQYRRQKTAKPYDIKVTGQLSSILNYYLKDKEKQDFIFSIACRDDIQDQSYDVQWGRKRYNKRLKEIANLCDIEDKLINYVSRQSVATNLILNDVPINTLSKVFVIVNFKQRKFILKIYQLRLWMNIKNGLKFEY